VRRETFPTPGPLEISVKVPAGLVDIETDDVSETTVELSPMHDDESAHAAVEASRIELRERTLGGQALSIVVPEVGAGGGFGLGFSRRAEESGRRFRLNFFRSPDVLVRVRCPHGADLRTECGSSDFRGRGRFGTANLTSGSGDLELREAAEFSANTGSGDVEVGQVARSAKVNSASGDVQIARLDGEGTVNTASGDVVVEVAGGPLQVNSASGDVVVGEAGQSVTVRTASGDVRLSSVGAGEINLKSASGDIEVGVRRGTKVWLDVQSRSGDTNSDLDVGDDPPADGSPVLELRANTMSGDVRIGRAPGRAVETSE
jgi:Putative adhesin